MHAYPLHRGRGVTVALVDSGFYPHPDLIEPSNRIRAWVDTTFEPVEVRFFGPRDKPEWPGCRDGHPTQWHGMMTSVVACGNGFASDGLYRGLASEADVVLIQVAERTGRIRDESIHRALRWLAGNAERIRLRVVNLSVAGDGPPQPGNPIDQAAATLVRRGICVVAASGNDGVRKLLPPATCPDVITVGGLDEQNTDDHLHRSLWHSNYGESTVGALKPELIAPSIWVVAPLLPGTRQEEDAGELFQRQTAEDRTADAEISRENLVSPHYKLVEGTSFAAPIVSSTIACMLEANPSLTPQLIRQCIAQACEFLPGTPREQQGLGALDSGRAVAQALRAKGGAMEGYLPSPHISAQGTSFLLHHLTARRVEVFGSWNHWKTSLTARQIEPGVWRAAGPVLPPGRYIYKFLVDGEWLDDPANPRKISDGHGGYNSVLIAPTDAG